MADRFPLILNTNANQIQEIASGDTLDLTNTNIKNAGIITATSFSGPIVAGAGVSNITSGIGTFTDLRVGGDTTFSEDLVVTGNARVTGILTVGTSSIILNDSANTINVGTALTLGHTQGLQFHTQNLHSAGFEVNQINASGIITATEADINGDIDVDGHTNLDNVSVAGVTTFTGNIDANGDLDVDGHTDLDNVSVAGVTTFTGNIDANGDLDVDGHTNLDNVSISGVTTFSTHSLHVGIARFNQTIVGTARTALKLTCTDESTDTTTYPLFVAASSGDQFPKTGTNLTFNSASGLLAATQLSGSIQTAAQPNITSVGTLSSLNVSGNLSVGGVLTYEDVTNIDSVGIITARKGVQAAGYAAIGGSPHSYLYGRGTQGGGFSVYAAESAVEVVSTEDGSHGSSLLLRTATDGVGFNYNPSENALELKSYTPNADNFTIHQTGSNITGLKNLIKAHVGSNVSLYHNGVGVVTTTSTGATINQLEFSQDTIKRSYTNSRIVFHGSNETRLYHAANDQVKLAFRGNGDNFRGAIDASPNAISIKTDADEVGVVARSNSFTELYYNGSKKLNTEDGGVFITGICTATSFSGPLKAGDSEVNVADAGSGGEVTIKADNTDVLKVIKGTGHVPGKVGINQFSNRKSPLTVAHSHATSPEPNISLTCPSLTDVGSGTAIFMKSSNDITAEKRYGTLIQSIRSDNDNGSPELVISMEGAQANALEERLKINKNGHILPGANNTFDFGSTALRWRNIYTNDLNLSNEGKTNDVDNTWGDYTIQEGESDLFLINNRSGKKYKFNLTEVS